MKWATICTVRTAARGEEFAFQVRQSGATWTFLFEPHAGGTRLTETRVDGEKPLVAKVFALVVPNRDDKLREGMRQTIERIKVAAEAGS